MEQKSEVELIASGQNGDTEAIAELFRRHYPSSLNVARNILRQGDESQDAVQVAYLLAFRHLARFRGDACFKTWITRIVVNCCLLELRKAKHRVTAGTHPPVTDRMASDAPTPEKATWCREIASAFSDAVRRLPRHLREAYTLHAVSGLSLKEVAAKLGVTESAAKTRLFRARAGIRSHLKPVWTEDRRDIRPRTLVRQTVSL
jgi:RNA polymerase sigma-70 factor (ECF subfamily)